MCESSFKNQKQLYTHIRDKHPDITITVPKGAKKDKIEDKVIYSFTPRTEVPTIIYNTDLEKEANKLINDPSKEHSEELKEIIIKLKIETLKQISEKSKIDFDYLLKKYL